jgi:hypothetical protein
MEDGGWRMEDGGWRMEDGGWRMEDGGWRMLRKESYKKRLAGVITGVIYLWQAGAVLRVQCPSVESSPWA